MFLRLELLLCQFLPSLSVHPHKHLQHHFSNFRSIREWLIFGQSFPNSHKILPFFRAFKEFAEGSLFIINCLNHVETSRCDCVTAQLERHASDIIAQARCGCIAPFYNLLILSELITNKHCSFWICFSKICNFVKVIDATTEGRQCVCQTLQSSSSSSQFSGVV